jgi:hypothetical protein
MSRCDRLDKVDKATAAHIVYCGLSDSIVRVECFDSSHPWITIKGIAKLDLQVMRAELADPTLPVLLVAYVNAWKFVDDLIEKARMSGVWTKKVGEI